VQATWRWIIVELKSLWRTLTVIDGNLDLNVTVIIAEGTFVRDGDHAVGRGAESGNSINSEEDRMLDLDHGVIVEVVVDFPAGEGFQGIIAEKEAEWVGVLCHLQRVLHLRGLRNTRDVEVEHQCLRREQQRRRD